MTWSLFRWTWLIEAPLYVGTAPAGSLNRCRLYVPARTVWGAVTAELAPRQANGFPDYQGVGNMLQESARFTYLYPAQRDGQTWFAWLPRYERREGVVWRREDRSDDQRDSSDRSMRMRLLGTRPGTAIDPLSDTAAEKSLRETECVNTHWRGDDGAAGSPVALVGYVLLRREAPEVRGLHVLTVGGDTRYGLGRLRRVELAKAETVFGGETLLNDGDPLVRKAFILAHAASARELVGDREALAGWNRTCTNPFVGFGTLFWVPGSRLQGVASWRIDRLGFWNDGQ
jgi:hypothetical protein